MLRALVHAALLAACSDARFPVQQPALPASTLAVHAGSAWRVWWRSSEAPTHYNAALAALAPLVRWKFLRDGAEWSELELAGRNEAWRTRVIVARIDPRRSQLWLDTAFAGSAAGWSIDRAPASAFLAVNAGQFLSSMPWGWVVLDGRQFLAPAAAPLATTLTVAADGTVRLVHATVPSMTGVRWAFQSYPTLLAAGAVPLPLQRAGGGVDVAHRDARLAVALDAQGRLIVAMTRFDALGPAFSQVPFGLTTPEMAAVIGALGGVDAVLLDGGVSAQMLVRDARGVAHRWPGVRRVPLALLARPR